METYQNNGHHNMVAMEKLSVYFCVNASKKAINGFLFFQLSKWNPAVA